MRIGETKLLFQVDQRCISTSTKFAQRNFFFYLQVSLLKHIVLTSVDAGIRMF
jgi:hypothetical protein